MIQQLVEPPLAAIFLGEDLLYDVATLLHCFGGILTPPFFTMLLQYIMNFWGPATVFQ